MPSLSPHPSSAAAMPPSPHGGSSGAIRPTLMKRQSSQSSNSISRQGMTSPGSGGELALQAPRPHHVKATKHAKIVLPRNHSSGRNLAKLARQAHHGNAPALAAAALAEDPRQLPARGSSHEADTDIRLPGSLSESRPAPMRRNLTALQLPRNTSHTKLKKNLSHGQLNRIGSGRNLVGQALSSTRGPPSPGVKGKSRRQKSVDTAIVLPPPHHEKDLHQQEVELAEKMRERGSGGAKVGFAVGSLGDASDEDNVPAMEGSGLQEDEWEDQSGSASPQTTRQNTANNSRRPSVDHDKPPDKRFSAEKSRQAVEQKLQTTRPATVDEGSEAIESSEGSEESDEDENDDSSAPTTIMPTKVRDEARPKAAAVSTTAAPTTATIDFQSARMGDSAPAPPEPTPQSSTFSIREPSNPTTKHLLGRTNQTAAPALVSNVSALDDLHSSKASPAPSMLSTRSTPGDGANEQEPDEFVSYFIPSTSHPGFGSGVNTQANTPKQISFHTPESDSVLAAQHREKKLANHSRHSASPASTISGSSGAVTPAYSMSRTELRLKNEKFMADMEDAAAVHPPFPPHRFDRRNESLRSYLNSAALHADSRADLYTHSGLSLGPEIFKGRFKAVNTELKVVQKFHNPIAASLARLQKCKSSPVNQRIVSAQTAQEPGSSAAAIARLSASQSALGLSKQPSNLSTSASPPKNAGSSVLNTSKSFTDVSGANFQGSDRRDTDGEVTVAQQTASDHRRSTNELAVGADAIARRLWDDLKVGK